MKKCCINNYLMMQRLKVEKKNNKNFYKIDQTKHKFKRLKKKGISLLSYTQFKLILSVQDTLLLPKNVSLYRCCEITKEQSLPILWFRMYSSLKNFCDRGSPFLPASVTAARREKLQNNLQIE